jgi:hypothetical protein
MRKLGVLFAFMFMLVVVPSAEAEITSVFGGKIPCVTVAAGQQEGQVHCQGTGDADDMTVDSWDGTPIDVNVGFPDAEEFGDGPYPMAMYFHGFGGRKENFGGDLQRFLDRGIAVFSMTERGFNNSCGEEAAYENLNDAGRDCSDGFIHLMDTRYEVRDAQHFMGLLADENLVLPKKIGTVGASYGGGKSMALAALKNRVMKPDGTYMPWKSPAGKDMEIAAAAPIVPWTDFAYALLPNGRTLDYVKDSPYRKPFGVMKIGIISALLPSGDRFSGDYGDPVQEEFDIRGWRTLMQQGEPYGGTPTAELMFNEMTRHHSSYYIDDSVEPAPLLIAQGFTDELFPVNEPLRYYNRSIAKHPDSNIQLLFADIGHPRAPLIGEYSQGRPLDKEMGFERVDDWFSHFLLDDGSPEPPNQVEVKTQVCPYSVPSGGPYVKPTWAALAPGEIRLEDPAARTIAAGAGLPGPANGFTILKDGCSTVPDVSEPGTAEYDLGTAPAGGVTLMGGATVIADISVANGGESQVAARLFDINPATGTERLISRTIYRPDASGPQVIQLHGNAYRFEEGHRIRLQLLPKDGVAGIPFSYVRPSNDQRDVTVSDVDIRVPVMEAPGAAGGMVKAPAPKVLPAGAELAGDYSAIGSMTLEEWARRNDPAPPVVGNVSVIGNPTVKGRKLTVKVRCKIGNDRCKWTNIKFRGAPKKGKKGKGLLIAKGKARVVKSGGTKKVKFKLTGKARKFFKDRKVRRKGKKKIRRGPNSLRARAIVAGKNQRFVKVKRVGRVR